MYDLFAHGKMIADTIRLEAYFKALRAVVRPDSVVLDIGTGTGIFALLACQLGAGRVYAIEPDQTIQVAKEIAAANGWAERIDFVQKPSTRVSLPEKADLIVSDLRGVLPMFQDHIPSIVDARRRLLKPGGIMIPQRDVLHVAVVEAPELYGTFTHPWDDNPFGIDMKAVGRVLLNTWGKARLEEEQLLTEGKALAVLDYRTIEIPDVQGQIVTRCKRQGTGHGIVFWFDAVLTDGIGFSNAPWAPELIYGSGFFPWLQPVSVEKGDKISVFMGADLVGEDYLWRWESTIRGQGKEGRVKARFRQSTFHGVPLSPDRLRKGGADYRPTLDKEGEIDLFVMEEMNGKQSLQEISKKLLSRFPHRFQNIQEALSRVAALSRKFAR